MQGKYLMSASFRQVRTRSITVVRCHLLGHQEVQIGPRLLGPVASGRDEEALALSWQKWRFRQAHHDGPAEMNR